MNCEKKIERNGRVVIVVCFELFATQNYYIFSPTLMHGVSDAYFPLTGLRNELNTTKLQQQQQQECRSRVFHVFMQIYTYIRNEQAICTLFLDHVRFFCVCELRGNDFSHILHGSLYSSFVCVFFSAFCTFVVIDGWKLF